MKKGNEEKIKEILNELEDELVEDENKKNDVVEEVNEKKSREKKLDKDEKIKAEKKVEKKAEKKEKTKKVDDEEIEIEGSPIGQVGKYLVDKIKEYKYVLILDFVVFLFLFFVVPTVILDVKPVFWMSLFLIFTILPTIAFYIKNLFKKYQVVVGIPFFYICILCILDSCTINDLYGITAHGTLDKLPAWVDAILVTFIIVFLQYIGLLVMDIAKKYLNCGNKKIK